MTDKILKALLFGAGVVLGQWLCSKCEGPGHKTLTPDTTIRLDSLELVLNFKADTPEPVKVVERDSIFFDTTEPDTPEIITDYFRARYYSLSFEDSPITGQFQARVAENELQEFEVKARGSKVIEQKTITKPPEWLITGGLGPQAIEAGALYRGENLYFGAGYNFAQSGVDGARAKIAIPIK